MSEIKVHYATKCPELEAICGFERGCIVLTRRKKLVTCKNCLKKIGVKK